MVQHTDRFGNLTDQPTPEPLPPQTWSPSVHTDRSVTFRLHAPGSQTVMLSLEGYSTPQQMARDSEGVWSVTLGPLEPSLRIYSFLVDGLQICDPSNPYNTGGIRSTESLVDVPGIPPRIDQHQNVPHGAVQSRHYFSEVLTREKSLYVYTPPSYDTDNNSVFPVLYLRHGAWSLEGSWLAIGRADVILDNLIAQGIARPMVVVMSNGYIDSPIGRGFDRDQNNSPKAFKRLGAELVQDIIPLIESKYRVSTHREDRAIAGLSMGAGQAFFIGSWNRDVFSWIGELSSGRISFLEFDLREAVPGLLDDPVAANRDLRLLWMSCGSDDLRAIGQRRLSALLTRHGIRHKYREIPGGHEWKVWRVDLADFVSTIFQ